MQPERLDEHIARETDGGPVTTQRNRYFTGKPMTARDFTDEQRYFVDRHRLHNRLFHEWGIVCGLAVDYHWNPECQDRWVIVRRGIATDCYGRELVVAHDTPIRLDQAQRPDAAPPPAAAAGAQGERRWEPPSEGLLVYLQYQEEATDCLPVLYTCDHPRKEPSRIREVARIKVVRFDEAPRCCWRTPGGDPDCPCQKGCGDEVPAPAWGCLEPSCPCGGWVPLALITDSGYHDDQHPSAHFKIDDEGVWRVRPPREYLTSITRINWTHGGDLKIGDLQNREDRELRVWFDRPLRAAQGNATGINEFTFVVQYGNVQRDLEFLYSQDSPTLSDDDCVAVFKIDDDFFRAQRNLVGNDLYVTLKCDFLLDCNGIAVDGDHIGGRLPSGDGVAGGTFESWFRVVS